ncbi:MAG: hypothetical protein JSS81_25595 [Acidobacteria bacterium]|nr:hypothetical protein [Acidobacteriota bacterium]
MNNQELLKQALQSRFAAHHEWLSIRASGRSFAFRPGELEIEFIHDKLLIGFPDDAGFQTWRVVGFQEKNEEIRLELVRNFERERERIRFVPRRPANELGEAVELARAARADRLAALVVESLPGAKLVRVRLSRENGRSAQILFEDRRGRQTAALGDVSDSLRPETLLSTAVLWLKKLEKRRRHPVDTLWLTAAGKQASKLQRLHALLDDEWRRRIVVKEIGPDTETQSGDRLKDLPALEPADLWRAKTRPAQLHEPAALGELAQNIVALAPDAIDVVFSRGGATLRFNGLAFARARRVFGRERIWFGTEKEKQILTPDNAEELAELIDNLRAFRRHGAPNRRHAFYRDAPEAWLESMLRRNIKKLDANLVLAPLYHQFRAEREKIDLLALRRDGRLVIVELKAAPDRDAPFQIADYWQRIERQRRAGHLQSARLFGELAIADAPAVCYLVAPALSVHRDFALLAGTLAAGIEIHRFHLAENWRAGVKVLERVGR